jgi:hypothetical protein
LCYINAMYGFQQWNEVIEYIEAEQLGFDDGKTKISSTQLVDDINLIAQWVPETHLQNEKMSYQGIALWIHQLSSIKKGLNYVGVPILHTLANAIRLASPLHDSKTLLKSLHTDHGMLLQLQATYFVGKHIHIIGIEQERGRVDIVAQVEDKVLNLHVKNTQPFTKEIAQFQAIAFIQQALRDHPITNSANEQLVVIKLDGYVPTGIPITYWGQFVNKIQPQSGVQRFDIVDPRDPTTHSPIILELVWQRSPDTVEGTLFGINLFQHLDNRLSDICKKIPVTNDNIEIALLLNRAAQSFQMDRSYFDHSKLDGIIMLDIVQGAEGWIYKRSNIYLRTSLVDLEKGLSTLLPEHVSLL